MNSNSIFKHRRRLEKNLKNGFFGLFTQYETPKLVLVHSLSFAILLRIMQILLLTYSIIYLLLYEKGYQKHDTAILSSVTLKVKGVGYVQTKQNETLIIDVADYIIPPSENNAVFIMTNFVTTDQRRSVCPETITLEEAICANDSECQNKPALPRADGRWTGRCVLSPEVNVSNGTENKPPGVCEYAGWCPPENHQASSMLINEVLNFTLFIKNFIEFPAFHVKHKNMVDNLKPCVFHPENARDCPIFRLNYIIDQAEQNATERSLMLQYGGVISIKLDWDCNLDRSIKLCKPKYSFTRLDVPFRENPFSFGFNFRYASYWKHNSKTYRSLTKAYGFRFIIAVSGKAGKFDLITLTLNTGSIVGIFGLATFFCDIILLHLSKQARIYRKHVFEAVHLKTRFNSKDAIKNNEEKYSNFQPKKQRSLSNGTYENIRRSHGQIIAIRPLTLFNSQQIIPSQSV